MHSFPSCQNESDAAQTGKSLCGSVMSCSVIFFFLLKEYGGLVFPTVAVDCFYRSVVIMGTSGHTCIYRECMKEASQGGSVLGSGSDILMDVKIASTAMNDGFTCSQVIMETSPNSRLNLPH